MSRIMGSILLALESDYLASCCHCVDRVGAEFQHTHPTTTTTPQHTYQTLWNGFLMYREGLKEASNNKMSYSGSATNWSVTLDLVTSLL